MKNALISIGIVVLLLSVFFYFEPVPGIKSESAVGEPPLLVALLGTGSFVSFLAFGLSATSLWFHLDREIIRSKGGITAVIRSSRWTFLLPPEHLLTDGGRRMAKIAKISLLAMVSFIVLMIVSNFSLAK